MGNLLLIIHALGLCIRLRLYYWLSQQVTSPSVVWDCACGTGQASVDLAAYFDRVEASDISESQITAATPHRKVNYQVCPAEKTPYPDHYFDVVCVAHALHWFDLEAFWTELKRVLKPGGMFVCWGYNWLQVGEAEDKAIAESVLPHLTTYWPPQSRLLWNQYRDIQFPFALMDVPEFEAQLPLDCYANLGLYSNLVSLSITHTRARRGFFSKRITHYSRRLVRAE
ncbi:class I SAM-dependent methyltransferase [Marinomonas sp. RS-M-Aa-14]|uniref:class I SAM-dependent methyltransferase n=1 Tax=Marinomonas sp. RS-M-Aa-14 TaxID=3241169 RepID=UPI003AAC22D1